MSRRRSRGSASSSTRTWRAAHPYDGDDLHLTPAEAPLGLGRERRLRRASARLGAAPRGEPRLGPGFALVVHDRDETRAAPLLERCGAALGRLARARRHDERTSVITCLPSPAAVTDVVDGDGGVLDALRAGSARGST